MLPPQLRVTAAGLAFLLHDFCDPTNSWRGKAVQTAYLTSVRFPSLWTVASQVLVTRLPASSDGVLEFYPDFPVLRQQD